MPIFKKLNRRFFKRWSSDMAYVLGFFAADGNLIKNKRGACFFALEICDLDILERIRLVMGSGHKIGRRGNKNNIKRRNVYRLQLGSRDYYNDLLKLGFSSNKTDNMSVPVVPKKHFPDFVRGYFDGDGNVWSGLVHKDRNRATLAIQTVFTSCSWKFLGNMQYRLEFYGINGRLRREGKYFRLVFSVLASLALYDLMYTKKDDVLYLKRKKVIFENYIRRRNAAVAQR